MQKISVILLSFLFVVSCGEMQQKPKEIDSPNGYKVTFLEDNESELIKEGEMFYFDVKYFADDSLMIEQKGEISKSIKRPADSLLINQKSASSDLITMLSPGDSVYVSQPISDLPQQSQLQLQGYETLKVLVYNVTTVSDADYQAMLSEQQMEKQKRVALADTISKVLNSNLELYESGKVKTTELEEGLELIVLEKGSGAKIQSGEEVTVDYIGQLKKDGTVFDMSYKRAEPFTFTVGQGQVIKGWDNALLASNHGDKLIAIIPADLAYGEIDRGTIPPNSDLVFYIEVK